MAYLNAYYARANTIARLLTGRAREAFIIKWEDAGNRSMVGARRSALATDVANALADSLSIAELDSTPDLEPGQWFQYHGPASFNWTTCRATIERRDLALVLSADLRRECLLTQTARVNMQGRTAAVSLLGFSIENDRFELVFAGQRLIGGEMLGAGAGPATIESLAETLGMRAQRHVSLEEFVEESIATVEHELQFGPARRLFSRKPILLEEKDFSNLYELAYGVSRPETLFVFREPERGQNRADFVVSDSHGLRHVVEFKQVSKTEAFSELVQRYKFQVPAYLDAYEAEVGWFVVFVQGDLTQADFDQLRDRLHDVAPEDARVRYIVVDARMPTLASRRRAIIDDQ